MIEIRPIRHGPNAGKWSWQIEVEKKQLWRGKVKTWGQRNGIAGDERKARSTAVRMLYWHQRDA